MAVDANGDGLDDQTGAPMASATGGMPVMSAQDIMAAMNSVSPTANGGGATNWMQDYRANVRQDWQSIPLYTGATRDKTRRVAERPHGMGGQGPLDETPSTHGTVFQVPQRLTPFQLLQDFESWPRKQFLQFKNKLVAAGMVSASASALDVRDAYSNLLQAVQTTQMQLPKQQAQEYTPFELVNNMIRLNGLDPNKIPAKDGWDPAAEKFQPSTQKVTSVYDLDPAGAEAMLTQMLQQNLGRDPSKAEVEDFVDAVKSRALADPTTQVTKVRRGDLSERADGNTQVSVTKQGGEAFSTIQTVNDGFGADDAGLLAQKRVENAPDYASYQAVSQYFPALIQALGATI